MLGEIGELADEVERSIEGFVGPSFPQVTADSSARAQMSRGSVLDGDCPRTSRMWSATRVAVSSTLSSLSGSVRPLFNRSRTLPRAPRIATSRGYSVARWLMSICSAM